MELFGDNRIDELEGKIEKLIDTYKSVKEEREKLATKVQALETENKELKDKVGGSKSEKELITSKISKILEKLEKAEV
jgi:septal ring factor EnvC (AmiA/AmiB activator)